MDSALLPYHALPVRGHLFSAFALFKVQTVEEMFGRLSI